MKKIVLFVFIGVCISTVAIIQTYVKKDVVLDNDLKELKSSADKFALEELIEVVKKCNDAESIDAEFVTSLISSDKKTVLNKFEGKYKKDKNNLFIQSFGSKNILNNRYFIAIDDDEKLMFVEKPEFKNNLSFFQFGYLLDVDSLINLPDSIVFYSKLTDNQAVLTIELVTGQYYKTEIFYNIHSKLLFQINLYPLKDVFIDEFEEGVISDNIEIKPNEIDLKKEFKPLFLTFQYNKLEINKGIDSYWFDETKYFVKSKNKLVPTKAFKNYEIEFE